MKWRFRRVLVLGIVFGWLIPGSSMSFSDPVPTPVIDKWNKPLGDTYGGNGGWVARQEGECSVGKDEFLSLVRGALENSRPKLEILKDDEFNKVQKPEVLCGIRLKAVNYPDSEGGFIGIGCTSFQELTQCYIQLLGPDGGKSHFVILTRSARHSQPEDVALKAYPPVSSANAANLPQPRRAPQIAAQLKTLLVNALLTKDNPPQ